MRILAGVGAWLLGAGAATGGSLLAVSLLGQGIADSQGQQLTTAAVNRALALESREASQPGTWVAYSPSPTPSATRHAARRPVTAQTAQPVQPRLTPSATPAATWTSASPAPSASGGTVLTSPGGTVLAECRAAGTYLVSWSPTQGYEAASVVRGPVATARVVFESDANSVTMVVSCPDGTAGQPVSSSYIHAYGGGSSTDE
jgi:hypothetical protein